jgi:hypothetical protein
MAFTLWGFAPEAASSVPQAILALGSFALALFTKVPPLAIILGAGALRAALGALVPGW